MDSEIDMTLDADTNSDTNTNKNGLNIEVYKNSLIYRADKLHSFRPKIKIPTKGNPVQPKTLQE